MQVILITVIISLQLLEAVINIILKESNLTGDQITGTRDTKYENTDQRGGIYMLQVDSVSTIDSKNVYNSFFRKTDAGIYYYLDTTGFSENLPPEYVSYIPYLKIDQEMLLFSTPLQDGKNWPVFKVNLEEGITVTVVDVEAKFLGKENIALNLNSGTITREAAKIEYSFSLINPITQSRQTVTADGWFVADIGASKMGGEQPFIKCFYQE